MPTLIDLLAEVEVTVNSVSSISNASPEYLLQLETKIQAAQDRTQQVMSLADGMLGAVGQEANFRSGLDPVQLIVNVSNLVATSGAVPYLVDVGNQLGLMVKEIDLVAAFGGTNEA